LGRYQKAQTTQGAQFLHNKFPGITILDAEDSLKSDIDKGLSAIEKALDKIPNEHRALIKTINIHSAADGNILAFTNEGTIIFNGWTKEKIDLNNDTVETLASAKRTEQMFWHETGHLVFANLSEDQKQEYKKLALASGVEDRMKLDKELFAEDYRNITATAEAAKEFNHMWRKSYRNGDKPIDVRGNKAEREAFFKKYVMPGSASTSSPITGQSGMENPGFINPERLWSKDNNFLGAVDYFNTTVISQDKISWENAVNLFSKLMGEDVNAESVRQLNAMREKSAAGRGKNLKRQDLSTLIAHKINAASRIIPGFTGGVLELANSRINSEGLKQKDIDNNVRDIATWIYTEIVSSPQFFYGLRGFGDAGGHNRVAWFIMNYFLIKNGYAPFYFKDARQYNTTVQANTWAIRDMVGASSPIKRNNSDTEIPFKRIFYVDDRFNFRAAVSDYIQQQFPGAKVFSAGGFAQAKLILETQAPFDLIITDLTMGDDPSNLNVEEKEGGKLVTYIRSKGSSRVPIMILSASVKGNEAKLKRMGADYFVDKNAASGFLEGLRFGIVNMAKKSSSPINGEIPLHQAKILTLEVSSELQELRIFYHDVDKIINVLAYVKRAIKLINKYGFNNDHKIDNIITKVDNLVNDIEKTKKPQKEKYSNNIRALLNVIETSEIMVESDKKEFEDNLNALRNFVPEYTAPLGEINTAIDILDGFMFGLPESPQKEQVRSFLKNSKQDVENVKRHIAEFSNEGVLEDGNIAAFLNDYVNVAKRHNPGVEISYKGPESRNMRVNFNEYSLRRVLDNMVNNAIVHGFGGVEELKNITPGESKIEVVLEAVDGQAQVVIRDNGQGVKSGTEQKIFDYEFTTGGTGIGLSSVKDVIKKHNGAVVLAESQEGWGATFKITLPLASSPIENKAAADSIRNNETRVKDIFDKLVSEKKLGGVQLPKQFKRAYALILSYGLLGEGDVKSLLENRLSAERYQGIEPYVGRESVSKEIDKAQSQLKGIYSQYAPGRQPGGHIVFFDRQGHEAEYDPVTDTIYLRADDYFGIAPFLSHEDTHRDQMLAPEFITEGVADYVAKEVADKLGQPFRVNHQASVEFVTGLANELGKPAILKAQYSSLETLAPVVGKEAVEYLELLAVIEHLIPAIGRNVLKNTRMFTSGGMTALWNNKDNEMLIKGLNNYIIGELKVALGNIEELKRSKDFASTISRINDYVMGEFDNASVARDSGQISLDRLIFKERWTDSDKTKFSEAILKACKAACGLISREEQKNYPNYAGPVYDALAFLSVSLPQELNDMLKETFGLESDRVLIFYGLKERKVVDIDDNAGTVTLFNIPVAKISLSENDTLKVTFLLKDSDIEIIRNKLLERIDNTAYFKKVIEDKISSSPVERKNIQSPLIETLKGKGFNAEDFQNYISELINNELIDGVIVWGNITSADFNQTKPRVGLYLLLKADRDYSEKPRYSGVDVIALNGIEEGIKTAINGGGRFDYNIMHDAESSFDNSTTQFFNQNSLVLLSNDFVSDKDGRSKRLNELNQKLNSRKINPVFLENVYSLSPEGWNRIGIIGEASENQAPAGVSLNNTDASPLPIKENDRMIFPGQDVNAILKEAVTSLPASIFNPNSIKLGLGNVPVVTGILQDSQKYDQELTAFQIKGDGWAKTLSSVFSHLAHNSGRAKASEMVITTGLSADGNNILIEVKDNGQGIDKSLLDNGNIESIFEKDRSFRESPRPDQAGLGLYYSRIMVTNQMGGTIEVVRNVSLNDAQGTGKEPGVTFRISLPVNLPSVDINKKQEIADKGGIDLSNIKITLKNEEFVLGLNAADLKILRAAKALNENWDSLAVLYMHELMLLLKQNIASDITQRPALLNILSRLDSHKSLDEEVTVFYHTMLS
ncbi:response regulator, partial [bacterium]